MYNGKKIAVIIPCFNVKTHIKTVIADLPDWVDHIIVVDDKCPEQSGKYLQKQCSDLRTIILFHDTNQGVGGACISGYKQALKLNSDILVKMDGDGQMDPAYLSRLIRPIVTGYADYAKGNRFYHLKALRSMPLLRKIGNFGLTFLTKVASGFWHISDPTNGFTAIHKTALSAVTNEFVSKRYFFEISLLIQLNIVRATVCDIPIPARYGSEKSSLNIARVLFGFPPKLLGGFMRRLLWRYYVYDITATSVFFLSGSVLLLGGVVFGAIKWIGGIHLAQAQTAGTVALALLPIIIGFQMLLQAMLLDIMDKPDKPIQCIQVDDECAGEESLRDL